MIRNELKCKISGIATDLRNLKVLWEDPIKNEEDYQKRVKITAFYALWNEIGQQPSVDIRNGNRMRYYNRQTRRFNELREKEQRQKELQKIQKWIHKQKNPRSPYRKMMIHLYNLALNSRMKVSEIKQKAKLIRDRERKAAQRDGYLRLSLIEQAKMWEEIERGGRWQWITERPVKF
ncbi:MAG: hypothetical protein N2V71_07715 [Methanophagales archaeon]|nr:hypothetical protein [Methanophagales archaeon]